MKTSLRRLVLLIAGVVLFLSITNAASAQYAVATIANPTRSTIAYQLKWGDDGGWVTYYIYPGYRRAHYYPLDDDNRAPRPFIQFDDTNTIRVYGLHFYAAWNPVPANGKLYVFRWGWGLNLYEQR